MFYVYYWIASFSASYFAGAECALYSRLTTDFVYQLAHYSYFLPSDLFKQIQPRHLFEILKFTGFVKECSLQ